MLNKEGAIKFDGIDSLDLGFVLKSDIEISQPQRDFVSVEVPGRDGNILINQGRLKVVNQKISFYCEALKGNTIEQQIQNIKNMFDRGKGNYKTFEWLGEPDYQYKARVVEMDFTRVNDIRADIAGSFEMHPVKYLKKGMNSINLTAGEIISNEGTQISKPKLFLTGTGNITLTINSEKFVLKNITEGIIIDTEIMVATNLKGTQSQMDKIYTFPFPVLRVGDNVISWDNSSFKISIIPRWSDLA